MVQETTAFLKDDGEENWPTKLHVGCGSVYLLGYTNMDISGHLAASPTDVPGQNKTRIEQYYTRSASLDAIPTSPPTWVDQLGSFVNTGYPVNSVDKIVAIQALEHVSPYDARRTVEHFWNILKKDGVLILSVPDTEKTLCMLRSSPVEQVIRLLRGSGKDEYAAHLTWFTKTNLLELLQDELCFYNVQFLPNPHFYPAIVLRCQKKDGYVSGREYQSLPELAGKKVLDIGPGQFPLPGATHAIDIVNRPDLVNRGIQFRKMDLNDKTTDLSCYGPFDFVYASHVAEHLHDPIRFLKEIQEIGHAGYVECPSVLIDYVYQFGNGHAQWNCLLGDEGEMVFIARHEDDRSLFREGASGIGRHMYIMTHMETTKTAEEMRMRNFFWANQRRLNVIGAWSPNKKLKAVAMKGGRIWRTT